MRTGKSQRDASPNANLISQALTVQLRTSYDIAQPYPAIIDTLLQRLVCQEIDRETAHEWDRIWKLSQDLLLITDLNGKVVDVNPAWSEALGWSADDLIGDTAEWLIHPDDRDRSFREFVKEAERNGAPHIQMRILHKNGSYRLLSWLAVRDREFIYAGARDITGLKQTQEKLEALRNRLAQSSRHTVVDALTASIAHEIKQPLAGIVTNASAGLRWLDRSDPDLKEVRTNLEQIVRAGNRIDEIVASTRAMFSRETSEHRRLDVRALVGEVIAMVQGELETHRVMLRTDLTDQPLQVIGDRVQLQQVLLNLTMNAIDAMSSIVGRDRLLTIAAEIDENGMAGITVEDTGSGIERANLNRIFEPFFTTKSAGMGLGLCICRSIVETHGGKLWASPRSPFGTQFYLTMPRAEGRERARNLVTPAGSACCH